MDIQFSFNKRMLAVAIAAQLVLLAASFALGLLAGRSSEARAEASPPPAMAAASDRGNIAPKGK